MDENLTSILIPLPGTPYGTVLSLPNRPYELFPQVHMSPSTIAALNPSPAEINVALFIPDIFVGT